MAVSNTSVSSIMKDELRFAVIGVDCLDISLHAFILFAVNSTMKPWSMSKGTCLKGHPKGRLKGLLKGMVVPLPPG